MINGRRLANSSILRIFRFSKSFQCYSRTFTNNQSSLFYHRSGIDFNQNEQLSSNDFETIVPPYKNHIQLTPVQKILLSIGSGLAALNDPYRDG